MTTDPIPNNIVVNINPSEESYNGLTLTSELSLSTMAEIQRTLEGEKYVTVSLVPFSLFKIREAYVNMVDNEDISPPVQHLVRVLLNDLDQRYVPQDDILCCCP